MDYNMLIAPMTLIFVELVKKFEVESKWLSLMAVGVGAVLGAVWAAVQSPMPDAVGWLNFIVQGVMYGASASGIYDIAHSGINKPKATE